MTARHARAGRSARTGGPEAGQYSKDVAAAIAAGAVRRAFLKGVGQANGCEGAAAPRA